MPNFSQYYKKDNRSSGLQPHLLVMGAVSCTFNMFILQLNTSVYLTILKGIKEDFCFNYKKLIL